MSASTEPHPAPEVIKLSIEDDEGVRATYPIIHEQIRVGRSEENEVCLAQRNISREHALLVAQPDSRRVCVHDLHSYTGIKLNGKRIFESCYLNLGDYLEIGGYVISLDIDGVDSYSDANRQSQAILRSEVEALPQDQHAKLVVVSNNLAGREYYLNRVEMLIGREQSENDLVINHRSISRNHAKIVWKNNEFTIFDLSSANGVLIGGSPFGAARLVKGSIIQMGHVKLRYVAPGEDYTFNPVDVEVTSLDEPQLGRRVIGAILVFVTIFFLSRQLISSLSSAPSDSNTTEINVVNPPLDSSGVESSDVEEESAREEGNGIVDQRDQSAEGETQAKQETDADDRAEAPDQPSEDPSESKEESSPKNPAVAPQTGKEKLAPKSTAQDQPIEEMKAEAKAAEPASKNKSKETVQSKQEAEIERSKESTLKE